MASHIVDDDNNTTTAIIIVIVIIGERLESKRIPCPLSEHRSSLN